MHPVFITLIIVIVIAIVIVTVVNSILCLVIVFIVVLILVLSITMHSMVPIPIIATTAISCVLITTVIYCQHTPFPQPHYHQSTPTYPHTAHTQSAYTSTPHQSPTPSPHPTHTCPHSQAHIQQTTHTLQYHPYLLYYTHNYIIFF